MSLTLRSTKGSPLTYAEADANFSGLADLSLTTFLQSGTGAVARTASAKMADIVAVKDWPTLGDDSTDNSAAVVNAVARGAGEVLLVNKGTFRLNSAISLPAAGLTIEGKGHDSVLKVGSNNQVLLQLITGGYLRLYNIRLVGDGTASSAANGIGLLCSDSGDIDLDTVWFEGFGFAAWHCSSLLGSTRTRIRGRNITITGGKNPLAGENADIFIRGKFKDIQLENLQLEASASTPVANAVYVSQSGVGENWEGLGIRGIVARGHGKRGVVYNCETSAANFESGKASLIDAKFYSIAGAAFKSKNIDRLSVSDIYTESCDATPESAGNLQGSVLIVGCEDFTGVNVQTKSCGTDGIRFYGRAAGTAAGVGRSKLSLTNFICNTAVESGIFVGHNVQSLTVNAPHCYDCGVGARVQTTTALAPPTNITFNSPRIRRTTGNNAGILVLGLAGEQVGKVFINSPDVSEANGFGVQAEYIDYLQINGGEILDSGKNGVNTRGIEAQNISKLKLNGVRSSNDAGSTQTYGLRLGTGLPEVQVHNCDLANNATAPVSYVAPTSIRAAHNNGWLEGSATWNPGSLIDGAGETSAGITVTDAALGDFVLVSAPYDLQGITCNGYVSAANTVTIRLQNETTGTIDLASGTWTVRVMK